MKKKILCLLSLTTMLTAVAVTFVTKPNSYNVSGVDSSTEYSIVLTEANVTHYSSDEWCAYTALAGKTIVGNLDFVIDEENAYLFGVAPTAKTNGYIAEAEGDDYGYPCANLYYSFYVYSPLGEPSVSTYGVFDDTGVNTKKRSLDFHYYYSEGDNYHFTIFSETNFFSIKLESITIKYHC